MNSRNKGAAAERELARELRSMGIASARRGQQHTGLEGKDVVGVPGVHIECKRTERLNIHAAMAQSYRDAKTDPGGRDAEIHVVCHRRNNAPWLITCCLDDVIELGAKFWAAAQAHQIEPEEADHE